MSIAVRAVGGLYWTALAAKAWSSLRADGSIPALLLDAPFAGKVLSTAASAAALLFGGKPAAAAVEGSVGVASWRFLRWLLRLFAVAAVAGFGYCPIGRLAFARKLLGAQAAVRAAAASGKAKGWRQFAAILLRPTPQVVIAWVNAFVLPRVARVLARRPGLLRSYANTAVTAVRLLASVSTTVGALAFVRPYHFVPSNPWRKDQAFQLARPAQDAKAKIGVLVCNLGTVKSPKSSDVNSFLNEFLMDRRVVEVTPYVWGPVLKGFILPIRRFTSGALYQRLFDATDTGGQSPLLYHGKLFANGLKNHLGDRYCVQLGMRYGQPSIDLAISNLKARGCSKVICLPMYPQYSETAVLAPGKPHLFFSSGDTVAMPATAISGTTSASIYDEVFQQLLQYRNVPSLRVVPPFYDHPAYVQAVAAVAKEFLADKGDIDKFVLSYHGIPCKYHERSDPYPWHCEATTVALVAAMGWSEGQYVQTYQSQFGKDPWLKPATDETLEELAHQGVKRVAVITPGFLSDCLETIDENGVENDEVFKEAGGKELIVVPCVNSDAKWCLGAAEIIRGEAAGWE